MKKFLLASFFLANAALAVEDVKILSFTIAREGGGDFAAVVSRNAAGAVNVYTKSCGFQELSKDAQAQSMFTLSGQTASDAAMILSNKALLASDQSIRLGLTGTFPVLYVSYEYTDMQNMKKKVRRKIMRPLIVADNMLSPVFEQIEERARTASMAFCSSN